jgi:hypothetical protein
MYQTRQRSRSDRLAFSAATTRVQHRLRSMRAQRGQPRLDEELDPLLGERSRHLLSQDRRALALTERVAAHLGGLPPA